MGIKALTSFLLLACIILSCRQRSDDIQPVPEVVRSWQLNIPSGWPLPVYRFTGNPPDEKKFHLGRRLFYDPLLSGNRGVSCASCHLPSHAFSDTISFSPGVEGRTGNRNSPPLFNLAWFPYFMLDGGVNHLEIQPLAPITSHVEMDMPLDSLINILNSNTIYRSLFQDAFGNPVIDSRNLFLALAQFMGRMVSADSRYDRFRNGTDTLSSSELRGLTLFQTHCAACHPEPLFTDFSFRNNGMEYVDALQDSGRKRVTQDPGDMMKFRVPTLRNVLLTAPYMHDGRIADISLVLDHYRQYLSAPATLDPLLTGGIPLSESEKHDVIAFLGTLTDQTFLADPLYASPF